MGDELKPCPFCGAPVDTGECPYPTNRTRNYWVVCCPNTEACGAEIETWGREAVVEAWNRRADAADLARIAELEAEVSDLKALLFEATNKAETDKARTELDKRNLWSYRLGLLLDGHIPLNGLN